jgi:hypothetical protein
MYYVVTTKGEALGYGPEGSVVQLTLRQIDEALAVGAIVLVTGNAVAEADEPEASRGAYKTRKMKAKDEE